LIFSDTKYRKHYENLFEPLPDLSNKNRFPLFAAPVENKETMQAWQTMTTEDQNVITTIFANISKSIAAYERLLMPGKTKFDLYVDAIVNSSGQKSNLLTKKQIFGLKLFIDKAQCINCHNGPLLSNHEFHNTGILSAPRQLPSMGRADGIRSVQSSQFNCLGEFSDAASEECAELHFAKTGDELIGAHKTPTLRNVTETAPYMHAGQLNTLEEVIEHYDQAPQAMIGHNEIKPLLLSKNEKQALVEFLHSLTAPMATDSQWVENPYL